MREPRSTALKLLLGILLTTPLSCAIAIGRPDAQDFTQIERGRYLTAVADCAACHDDPHTKRPFAGGLPVETPFGNVLAPNITPDAETGIGNWSDRQFDAALREGKRPDGKRLYPAMPFLYYTKMSRADVLAIRAYLATAAPVHHAVTADRLPFPFNIRTSLVLWDGLYFKPGVFRYDAARSAEWNRGAFLVEGPGHCGACHTPKTVLGGDKTEEALQGYSLQGWFAPNLTGDAQRGLSAWSRDDIIEYLKKGHNRLTGASGPMANEISHSSSKMSATDLQAIAAYLKDLPGQSDQERPLPADDPVMTAGAAIYGDLCSACHKSDGSGVPYLIPDLAASASVDSRDPTTLIRVVLEGSQTVATAEEPTAPAMPAFGWQLSDAQVAAVITYISNSWNHARVALSEGEVHKARAKLAAKNQ